MIVVGALVMLSSLAFEPMLQQIVALEGSQGNFATTEPATVGKSTYMDGGVERYADTSTSID